MIRSRAQNLSVTMYRFSPNRFEDETWPISSPNKKTDNWKYYRRQEGDNFPAAMLFFVDILGSGE